MLWICRWPELAPLTLGAGALAMASAARDYPWRLRGLNQCRGFVNFRTGAQLKQAIESAEEGGGEEKSSSLLCLIPETRRLETLEAGRRRLCAAFCFSAWGLWQAAW